MTPPLHIYLLGDFRLDLGDETPLSIPQARHQALLTYLLLHRHAPQARRHLAFLLWPDSSEPQALTNLRKALTHLRQMTPILAQALYADHQVVQWRPMLTFTLDVAAFENKLDQATAAEQTGHVQDALALWSAAVAHYTGPLTPSCYDDWLITERERLHQLCLGALERLVAGYERNQEPAAAIPYAQQLLRLDPLQETAYVQLMRLQAVMGDRAAALRTYHTCVTVLARELGVEPAPETQEVYARLLNLATSVKTTPRPRSAKGLVGRQVEWEQLQRTWRLATTQGAHFLCIWGEAGIGKTRLAEELLTWAGQQGFTVARTRAYAGEGQLAYAPVVEWLRAEPVRSVRSRLAPVWLSEVARLLPELLSEQPTVPVPNPMTEPWQRQRLWEALARTLLAAAQPLLLVIDDLQWCDTETLEWLRYLLHFVPQERLLVVGTARPEEVAEMHPLQTLRRHLRSSGQLTELELGPLDDMQSALLATQVAPQPLDAQTQQALYRATAGNPLFMVEMVRAGVSKESASLPSHQSYTPTALPPKVQAVIQSRLAQLSPPARALAHLAAVIGQDFTFELLLHASGQDEGALVLGMDELWQRRIIREQGVAAYDFSHDRIRDVAYMEISPIRRRQLHRCVAQALEAVFEDNLSILSGQLATHYEQAGFLAQAVGYYHQAAEKERQLFATDEALTYLARGFDLLKHLSHTPEVTERELAMQMTLGGIWSPIKGYGSPEVGQIYERALTLCQQLAKTPQLFPALWGLHEVYLYRAEFAQALKPAAQCLQIAQRAGDAGLLLQAYHALWGVYFYCGPLASALTYAEQGIALYNTGHYQAQALDYGVHDAGVCALHISGLSLWLLGYPDQARQKLTALMTLTDSLTLPILVVDATAQTAMVCQCLRQVQPTQAFLQRCLDLCIQYGYSICQAHAQVMQGWTVAVRGDSTTGIPLMHQGLTGWQATGQRLLYNYFYALLAEGYALAGRSAEGLELLMTGQALATTYDDHFYRAELYRLQGDLLLAHGEALDKVAMAYQQAIAISRQRQEKSLELRATIHLARLWQQQARIADAYQLLSGIYNWFTEGFDTADLVEAKALLDELV